MNYICYPGPLARYMKLRVTHQSPHRISAGGSLLFMSCVSLTLTGLVSAWRRGEAASAILAKPLSDCITVFCPRQCKSRHLKVCEILKKKIHAISKQQIEYLAFLTELCVVMLWVTPATRVVVVRFFFNFFLHQIGGLPLTDKNRNQCSPTNIVPWFKQ